jgi:hypothetical protein
VRKKPPEIEDYGKGYRGGMPYKVRAKITLRKQGSVSENIALVALL